MKNSYPEFFEFDFYLVQLFLIASIVLLMLIVAPLVKSKIYYHTYLFYYWVWHCSCCPSHGSCRN